MTFLLGCGSPCRARTAEAERGVGSKPIGAGLVAGEQDSHPHEFERHRVRRTDRATLARRAERDPA
jgi:hypothetical protein